VKIPLTVGCLLLMMATFGCNQTPATPAVAVAPKVFSEKPEIVSGNVDQQIYFKFLSWADGPRILVVDNIADESTEVLDGSVETNSRHISEVVTANSGYHRTTKLMAPTSDKEIYRWKIGTEDGESWSLSINGERKTFDNAATYFVQADSSGEISAKQLDLDIGGLKVDQAACEEFCRQAILEK